MHKSRLIAVLLASGCLAAAAAATAEPAYDYLEVGIASVSVGPVDGEGLRVAGSMTIDPNLYLTGGYSHASLDPGGTGYDALDLALGLRTALDPSLHLYGEIGLEHLGIGTASDNGLTLTGGLRKQLAPQLELDAYLRRTEVGNGDTLLGVAGVWSVSDNASLMLGFESGDVEELAIGLRFGF